MPRNIHLDETWALLERRSSVAIDWLREHLHWEISGGVVGILGGFVGQVLMQAGAFIASEICFGISGIVLTLWVVTWRAQVPLRIVGAVGILAFTVFLLDSVDTARKVQITNDRRIKLEQNFGILSPSTDPDPPETDCTKSAPGRLFTVLFGGSTIIIEKFPTAIVEFAGKEYFSLDRDAASQVALTVDIPDADGKIVATINKNAFIVNRNKILHFDRPDESTLKVIDEYNNTVLYVHYNNKKTMTIAGALNFGKLNLKAGGELVIGGSKFYEGCFSGNVAFGIF